MAEVAETCNLDNRTAILDIISFLAFQNVSSVGVT